MMLEMVVAADLDRGIGRDGGLPWPRVPRDLERLKQLTHGEVVIVGRTTFVSMQAAYMNSGKEMPGRRYIVVSRNSELDLTGVEMARSPKLAVKIAGELTNSPVIIGGAQLYQALLSDVSRIHYTRINGQYDCDTFFPELDVDEWSETLLQRYSAEDNVVGFDFLTYERIR